jgi:hypothetical protein
MLDNITCNPWFQPIGFPWKNIPRRGGLPVGESSVVELPNFPPPAPPLPAAIWALGSFRSEKKKNPPNKV